MELELEPEMELEPETEMELELEPGVALDTSYPDLERALDASLSGSLSGSASAGSFGSAAVSCAGDFYLNNGACEAWAKCTDKQYETQAPSNTQNRECATKTCTCTNGTGATGAACPTNGTAKCAACTGDFYLNNGACEAWATCTGAQYETQAPSNTQNRECATKQCTCANGTGAEGSACPTNGDAKCATCTGDFYLK